MRLRVTIAMALLGFLALLTPLAYASPADPTWNPGIWDDDDFDNVVDLITSGDGAVGSFIAPTTVPIPIVLFAIVGCDQDPPIRPAVSPDAIRAPPSP